jgi:HAD superfamily phosphatase (TIGR01668 family)
VIRLLALLAPRYRIRVVTDLTPAVLRDWGVEALMLDLDNTLVSWGEVDAPEAVRGWREELRRMRIPACVVSNNVNRRVRAAAAALDLPFSTGGYKPGTSKLRDALALLGTPPRRTAMVGDQLFTDILAGNRLGVPTILTAPLSPREPLRTRMLRRVERVVLAALADRGIRPREPV